MKTKEKIHLGLLWYGDSSLHWRAFEDRDIFRFKGEVEQILNSIALKNISFKLGNESGFKILINIFSNKTNIGKIGIPDSKVLKAYDLKISPTVCVLFLDVIRELKTNLKISYNTPVTFPFINRDIALQVKFDVPAINLLDTIYQNGGKNLVDVSLFDIYQLDNPGERNKSLAFSLKYQSETMTLTDLEVDEDIKKIVESLKENHGAIRR